MKKVGEVVREPRVKFEQQEMFPATFHRHYLVINHSMYIDENGKSVWASSQIMWRLPNGESKKAT